jgi:hypothetical protein
MRWILWPVHKYNGWVTQRELRIANSTNPLVLTTLIWNAFETAFPPVIGTILLLVIGFRLRHCDHVASVTGDMIAIIALWFGMSRSRDTSVIDAVNEVCRRSTNIGPYSNGYQHVVSMIPQFRRQLRFYNSAIIIVNFALFAAGLVLSFL